MYAHQSNLDNEVTMSRHQDESVLIINTCRSVVLILFEKKFFDETILKKNDLVSYPARAEGLGKYDIGHKCKSWIKY